MRLSAMVFVVSAAALIAACQPQGAGGDAAQAPAPPPPAGDTAEAAPFDLLRAEGAQVNWIEAQIGPARTVVAGEREYDIGDCTVRMQAEDEVVTGYAVPMSAACASLVLPVLAHYGLPETVEMTFGQFAALPHRCRQSARKAGLVRAWANWPKVISTVSGRP